MNRALLLLAGILLINCTGNNLESILENIPREYGKWHSNSPDEKYNRETLFKYINGGAELYLTYGFLDVEVRRFNLKDNTDLEIVMDIYNMGNSEEAYGIFSNEREDDDIGIGQDSEYGGGLLRLWKGKYFISMVVLGDESEAKGVMFEIARDAASAISEEGEKPSLIKMLPEKNKLNNEVRYFHSINSMNNHYYISDDNILNLDNETDCVFAPYISGDDVCYLLIVSYKDKSAASSAFDSFKQHYIPDADDSGSAMLENNKWTKSIKNEKFLCIVFDAPDKKAAEEIVSKIELN